MKIDWKVTDRWYYPWNKHFEKELNDRLDKERADKNICSECGGEFVHSESCTLKDQKLGEKDG